ncbi:MAG: hypothetical protein HC871_05935, partial [Rhizobiales bacterium]|nr:hypothetical protein [Hyphomicrobiales bacterium]
MIEGPGDEIAAARTQLDSALGNLEAAELLLLDMRRGQDPDGAASTSSLERVRELRRILAEQTDPASQSDSHAVFALELVAEEVGERIIGLQATVEYETARIAAIERRAGEYGADVHDAEQNCARAG